MEGDMNGKPLILSALIFGLLITSGCSHLGGSGCNIKTEPKARMSVEYVAVSPEAARAIDATLAVTVSAALRGDFAALDANLLPNDQRRIAELSDIDRARIEQYGRRYDSDWSTRYGAPYNWNLDVARREAFNNYQVSQAQDARHAVVIIPASENLPRVALRMVEVGNNRWVIDAPDTLSSYDVMNRLDSTLVDMDNTRADWPSDANYQARIAAHRVLSIFSVT